MNNQEWSKELLYSFIFFITAIIWFFFNPLSQMRDIVDSLPSALDIKDKLLDWGIFPIFYHVSSIATVGLFFFLLCSIYAGILSLKKASIDSERKIFGFIPKSISGLLAILLILASAAYGILSIIYLTPLLLH